jgi:micrococcal nuclease
MKTSNPKQFHLIVLVLSFLFATTEKSGASEWCTVRWVSDGDTIVLTDGRRVRYIGINAPEIDHEDQKAQPFGYKSRIFNKQLVSRRKIRLEFDKGRHDRYGRWLAYIFLSDGSFLNARLLQAGYAYYLFRKPNLKYDTILLKAQREAMRSKKGLWHRWQEKKGIYIGNRKSRRFHLTACPFAQNIKRKNRVEFETKWDAFNAGYAPAKKCIENFWSYELQD